MNACDRSLAPTRPPVLGEVAASGTADPRDPDPHLLELYARVRPCRVPHALPHGVRDDGDVHPVGDDDVDVHLCHVVLIASGYDDALVNLPRAEDAPYPLSEAGGRHANDA